MKARNLFVVIALAMTVGATAQTSKISYGGLVQAGLLEGERGSAFGLQTVQGLKYKTWSAGIGTGLDYYHTRSIPLFLDLRKTFSKKDKGAFVYADGGYAFPWLTTADKANFINKAKAGAYFDAGVGYGFALKKKNRLFFSAGYSYKAFKTIYEYVICPFIGPCFTQSEIQAYKLRRLSIKAGLSF